MIRQPVERDRLARLLVRAFMEDRRTMQPRSAWALVQRILATPAGRVLATEWYRNQSAYEVESRLVEGRTGPDT